MNATEKFALSFNWQLFELSRDVTCGTHTRAPKNKYRGSDRAKKM